MAIELIQKEQKPTAPKTYKIGDTFKHYRKSDPYMIIRSYGSKVKLVRLTNGNGWSHPVDVADDLKITEDEFDKITNGKSSDFIPTDYKLTEI